MNSPESALRLHDSTKHGTPPASPERLVSFRRLDPANAPRPFKEYRGLDEVSLPRQLVRSSLSASAVLSGEMGPGQTFDSELLASLLFLSAGVTRVLDVPGRRLYFRTAMAAGNLHPVEMYVSVGVGGVAGFDPGVYHFNPLEVSLARVRAGDYREFLGLSAPVSVILTGIPWRTSWKYGERGWRHLYWDAGTLLANLLAVADAHGLPHRTVLGFDDEGICQLLGIDGVEEMPLALVPLGSTELKSPEPEELEPLSPEVAPVARRPIRLPLLEDAQAGSTLRSDEVEDWRREGSALVRDSSDPVLVPPSTDTTIEDVILRRGSTREMVHASIDGGSFHWQMIASTRSVGLDVLPSGSLLDHYVNAHAIEGLEPGAYHLVGGEIDLIRANPDRLREESAALCLGQPLGGDSAYTIFHCAQFDHVLPALGSRGYRVAQLEAGVVSGRYALCAFALGLGATGLTFFDDLVSAFFETRAQPMLVTSVGVPAKPPAPAGTPGSPVALRR